MKAHVVVDCEASGPCPGFGSMISFAALVVEPELSRGWRSPVLQPYSERYEEKAYAAIGTDRERHVAEATTTVQEAMAAFSVWLAGLDADRVVFWSDNPAFDWQWVNHGFAVAGLANPFGFSARRIGDLYAGLRGHVGDTQSWKRLRTTPHTHDPLDDARGNAEALLAVLIRYGQLARLR